MGGREALGREGLGREEGRVLVLKSLFGCMREDY